MPPGRGRTSHSHCNAGDTRGVLVDVLSALRAGDRWCLPWKSRTGSLGGGRRRIDREVLISRSAFFGRAQGTTTNNRMELQGTVEALRLARILKGCPITIVSDSQYVINNVTEHLPNWKARGWRNSGGKPLKNRDLWEQVDRLMRGINVAWQWTPSNGGHHANELAHRIAHEAAKGLRSGDLEGLLKAYPEAFAC